MFTRRMIRIKAMQYLHAFFAQRSLGLSSWNQRTAWLKLSEAFTEDVAMVKSVYMELLHMLLLWGTLDEAYEKERLMPALRHLNGNQFLQKLRTHPIFLQLSKEYPSTWPKGLLQRWYYDTVQPSPLLQKYKATACISPQDDFVLIKKLVKKHLFSHKRLQAHIAQQYIGWSVDKQALNPLLLSFIKKVYQEDPTSFAWHQDDNFDAKISFYKALVSTVLDQEAFCEDKIAMQIVHWDRKRLILLDTILIKMGLAEALFLAEVPPSIVINEYVEIAKCYSTPKSHQFIHGLLNAIIQGTVEKSCES